MSNSIINKMVDRFLGWKLPKEFSPDHYVSFDRQAANELFTRTNGTSWPIGTNLLDAEQAKAMVEHMLQGVIPPENYQTEDEGESYMHGYFDGANDADRLRTQLSELQAENERLKNELSEANAECSVRNDEVTGLMGQLTAMQLYAKGLRDALPKFRPEYGAVGSRDVDVAERIKAFDAALNSAPPDLSAVAELVRDAGILRSRQVVGWMRGRDFIDLPEKARSTDTPVFIFDAAMLAAHKKEET